MKQLNVIGIDLAKNILQICKITTEGELVFNKTITPNKLRIFLAKEKVSIIAMEGCGSCHYWARLAEQHGHIARIISPKKVKAFLQGHKTDANDALAIGVAAKQSGMLFSQVKTVEQQMLQTLEKSRKFLEKDVTALNNHIRAFIYEYGITSPKGVKGLRETIVNVMDEQDERLPAKLKITLRQLYEKYKSSCEQLKILTKEKDSFVKTVEPCKRLLALEGVGPVCASLLYTSIGDGKGFKNGRHASVYVGVTPKQHSSGGKTYITGIDKKGGNKQLRAALFQGAFSVIYKLPSEPKTKKQAWLIKLVARVGVKRACIALSNKTVRTAWALLVTGSRYKTELITA